LERNKENEMTKDLKNILLGVGAGVLTALAYRHFKKSKKSNFVGGGGMQVVSFTLTNNSNQIETATLFNAFDNAAPVNQKAVSITPSMQTFNNYLPTQPMRVLSLEIRGANNTQASVPITKICTDASGQQTQEQYTPMVSAYQVQSGIVTVEPQNLILDGVCYLTYRLLPNSSVNLLMRYQQYNVAEMAKKASVISRRKKRKKRKKIS
jgi:hypothetical protein